MTVALTTHVRQGAARLRRGVASVLTAAAVGTTLVFAGAADPVTAQAGDLSPTGSLGGGMAKAVTETAAVLRGTEALAFTYQKIEWLIEEPPTSSAPASSEQMLLPDDHDRRRLVEALGSETILTLWCRGEGIIASSTEGTSSDFMATISEDATSWCSGTGGGVLVSQGKIAMLLCVDTRVIDSATTANAFIPGGSVVSASIGDAGPVVVGPPTYGANDTSGTSWCPETTDGVAAAQTAVTPVVFVCPTSDVIASSTEGSSNDVIASSTEGASSDFWDPQADGSDSLRCPGTTQRVEELLSSTSGADPLTGLRSMLHSYKEAIGHDDESSSLTAIVELLQVAPELGDLAASLGCVRLEGGLDVEMLAAVSRGERRWADLNDLELRSVLHHVGSLAVQLDSWYSGLTASTHQFKVEIEGVSAAWRPWLDARSTSPRLFDEADALFGKRTGPTEPSAARPTTPDFDAEPDTNPTTTSASRPTSTTAPRPTTTTTGASRPTTTTTGAPRPTTTTTVASRPTTTTTVASRPTTTTTVASRPTSTTTVAPRPTTTTTMAPERSTTTAGR